MADFRAYPKIHRLGKEETEGILDGKVTIQEKIDGANISIWLGDDGTVRCGSRTRVLPLDESFNGFQEAVNSNKVLVRWITDNPHLRLYGEWLVKHTITYPDAAYKKIYLFDIYDEEKDEYWTQTNVAIQAQILALQYPYLFEHDAELTEEQIKEFVGKTFVQGAANGEGVVIKREGFKDKWGNHCYAKLVHEQFKEANAIVFGGNDKHSKSYNEMYVVNKYCTLGRVQKIMQKLQAETEKRLDMEHTSEVAGRCLHDMITEEGWEIFQKGTTLNNKKLKGFANRKFIQIYHDVLNNSISVADGGQNAGEQKSGGSSSNSDIG